MRMMVVTGAEWIDLNSNGLIKTGIKGRQTEGLVTYAYIYNITLKGEREERE